MKLKIQLTTCAGLIYHMCLMAQATFTSGVYTQDFGTSDDNACVILNKIYNHIHALVLK
ncbi:MAG: hypothetical protein NZ529_06665 [Cytophagaceae bacterium]|nr:hypothetical protein [Cytophagaceae bacterium]MDW8456462.1 hypothetical protein [Cytophagaceae bacterium]